MCFLLISFRQRFLQIVANIQTFYFCFLLLPEKYPSLYFLTSLVNVLRGLFMDNIVTDNLVK